MNPVTCPDCSVPLPPEAVADGWCPGCGKQIPEFVRAAARRASQPAAAPGSAGDRKSPSWWPFILLVAVAATGGVMFGMAEHGQLTGPWAAIPVLIYVGLAVGRWVELRAQRRRREADRPDG